MPYDRLGSMGIMRPVGGSFQFYPSEFLPDCHIKNDFSNITLLPDLKNRFYSFAYETSEVKTILIIGSSFTRNQKTDFGKPNLKFKESFCPTDYQKWFLN